MSDSGHIFIGNADISSIFNRCIRRNCNADSICCSCNYMVTFRSWRNGYRRLLQEIFQTLNQIDTEILRTAKCCPFLFYARAIILSEKIQDYGSRKRNGPLCRGDGS